jgi:putative transposase
VHVHLSLSIIVLVYSGLLGNQIDLEPVYDKQKSHLIYVNRTGFAEYGSLERQVLLKKTPLQRTINVGQIHINGGQIQIKYHSFFYANRQVAPLFVATSWRMDETYVKVKGKWVYLYRTFDKFGGTIDFMLSEQRDEMAATAFFKKRLSTTTAFLIKSSWIKAAPTMPVLRISILLLMLAGLISFIEICQIKYLNNVIEQDHRFIKKITNPMVGFKAFHSAKATIDGIETVHMI